MILRLTPSYDTPTWSSYVLHFVRWLSSSPPLAQFFAVEFDSQHRGVTYGLALDDSPYRQSVLTVTRDSAPGLAFTRVPPRLGVTRTLGFRLSCTLSLSLSTRVHA